MTIEHEIGAGRVWQAVARAWPLLQSLPLSERSTRWAEDTKEFLLEIEGLDANKTKKSISSISLTVESHSGNTEKQGSEEAGGGGRDGKSNPASGPRSH